MNKKDRDLIAGFVAFLFLAGSIYLLFNVFSGINVYIKLSILIFGTAAVNGLTYRLLPKKKTTKKATSKKTTQNIQQRKNTSNSNSQEVPHNRLLTDDEILKLPLEKISWREFEQLCLMYYKAKGYKARLTKDGADGGVDLIYYDPQDKGDVAVQIKHYKTGNQITVEHIRSLSSSKRNHGCMLAELITSSTFTNDALLQADKFKVKTKDRHWVESNIIKWKDQEAKKKKLVRA